jgi:hypothetical protein
MFGSYAHLCAGTNLIAHVNSGGRIIAHTHRRETRDNFVLLTELRNFVADLALDVFGERRAVE